MTIVVTSGAPRNNVDLEFGEGMVISSGGSASYTTVSASSFVTVSSGGTEYFTTLSAYGYDTVLSGGVASGTTVLGGTEYVDGGIASGGIITFEVYSSVLNPGTQSVYDGGLAIDTTVANFGTESVGDGGGATGTTVSAGGEELVYISGAVSFSTLMGGQEIIYNGGVASGTVISSGGIESVGSGGEADGTSVVSGGEQLVQSGGSANFSVVSGGGLELVLSGGTANAATISAGGTIVALGGAASVPGLDALAGSVVVTAGVVVLDNPSTLYSAASGTVSGAEAIFGQTEYVLPGGVAIGSLISGGVENVFSGGIASGAMVSLDGTENVLSGGGASFTSVGSGFQTVTGTASGTTVGDLGLETVVNGGVANGTMVGSGGQVTISSGGMANFAMISNGGEAIVLSGGTASGVTISNGGTLIVLPGGNDPDANVLPGGGIVVPNVEVFSGATLVSAAAGAVSGFAVGAGLIESIYAGGTAISSVVTGGGEAIVFSGGTASGSIVQRQGEQVVSSGGVASFTVVSAEAEQIVDNGGTAGNTDLQYFSFELVSSGGVASFTTLSRGAELQVDSGGDASFTTLSAGAQLYVYTGGAAGFTTVSAGATDFLSGGTVTGTILNGGAEDVYAAASALATTVGSGGDQYVYARGTASGTVVRSGGTEFVFSGGTASGSVVDNGGRLIALPGSIVSGTVNSGGTIADTGVIILSGTTPIFIGSSYGPFEPVANGDTEYVLRSGFTTATAISGGAVELVYSGGIVKSTFVDSGGSETLTGGTASHTTVLSGGTQYVDSGGVASFTTVSGTAEAFVYSGGETFSTTLEPSPTFTPLSGGIESVFSGGVASGTLVRAYAVQYIYSSGTDDRSTVGFNATEAVYGGGSIDGTTISTGGTGFVYSGATASGLVVSKGGTLVVFPGAVVNATSVLSGAVVISTGVVVVSGLTVVSATTSPLSGKVIVAGQTEYVFPGGITVSSVISSGGTETVLSGGQASATQVKASGQDYVSSGGVASFTAISGGGSEYVYSGGSAAFASVSGVQEIFSGGAATSAAIVNGGSQQVYGEADSTVVGVGHEYVYSGGLASGAMVDSGGGLTVYSSGTVTGTMVSGGGSAVVSSAGFADGTILLSGGFEIVSSGGIASGTVMTSGAAIDLPFLTFSGGSATIDSGTDLLTVTQGGASYQQTLAGGYPAAVFSATADASGGTLVTLETPCYCRGTLILTRAGEVAVEDLRIGDTVLTHTGQPRPIRWIGRRAYAGRFAAGNREVLPVRIRAGALADGVPRRDLFVSPLHAMYLEGVLVPARDLVNRLSIEQAEAVDQVDYFHIELESHDVILAEGAPSETFVDDDSRGMFHNAAEFRALYPDAPRPPARYCAPRVEDGEALEAIRRRLIQRATGSRLEATADLTEDTGPLEGCLDEAGRERIAGWARNAADPDSPVVLRIFDNGVAIGEVTAGDHRPDLTEDGGGSGRHGFSFAVPGGLSPLMGHVIHVRRAADSRDLPNTPWILRVAPPPPVAVHGAAGGTCRGHIDRATREWITGWAWDESTPDVPVPLQVLDNGVPVARVLANLWRADLEQAAIGAGRHGFDIRIPGGLSPLSRHVIEVRREADGAALENSPILIEAADSFDTGLEHAIARAVTALSDPDDHKRVLSFMLAQAERLREQHGGADGRRAERRACKLSHRRLGPAAVHIADPGPRALVVDTRMPDLNRDAGSQAVMSHMRALQRLGYTVAFVAAEEMARETPAADGLATARSEALERCGITCYDAPLYCSVEDVLRRQGDCFDVVYLHRADVAARYLALARAYAQRARILYSVADLHHVRLDRQARVEDRPELLAASRRMLVTECTAAWSADAVITHSAEEAAVLRRLVPGANVYRVPWAVPVCATTVPFGSRHGVAFIGGYDHEPNRDAARWLVETVMPVVWRTDPWIACLLIGSAMPQSIRRLAGPQVETIGDVADLRHEVFDRVRLTVAPLRYGAGVKGKVLDSFAAGVPCVMSEIAAEGLALPPALAGLVGREPGEIAALICRLHADRQCHEAAVSAGISLIRRDFGVEVITEALRIAIDGRRQEVRAAWA